MSWVKRLYQCSANSVQRQVLVFIIYFHMWNYLAPQAENDFRNLQTLHECIIYILYTSFGRTLIASDWFVFLILLRGEKSLFEIHVLHANSIWLHEVWRLIPTSKSIFPCIQACKLQRSSNTQLYMKWQCCWVSCSPASGFSKGSLFCLVFHSVCFMMIFRFLIGCLALCWRWSISYAYSILLFVLHLTGL